METSCGFRILDHVYGATLC